MIELADTYLGNITENSSLSQRITSESFLEVYLSSIDNCKGRIYTHSTTGIEVGIVKNRDWMLREGDIFVTQQGKLLLVHLQTQKVMVLSFTQPINEYAINLVHLGHVLGNHHWPILIQNGKLYIQLAADEAVIEKTIHTFKIPGLQINYEQRSSNEYLTFSEHNQH